jgi:hypothetical protein
MSMFHCLLYPRGQLRGASSEILPISVVRQWPSWCFSEGTQDPGFIRGWGIGFPVTNSQWDLKS